MKEIKDFIKEIMDCTIEGTDCISVSDAIRIVSNAYTAGMSFQDQQCKYRFRKVSKNEINSLKEFKFIPSKGKHIIADMVVREYIFSDISDVWPLNKPTDISLGEIAEWV